MPPTRGGLTGHRMTCLPLTWMLQASSPQGLAPSTAQSASDGALCANTCLSPQAANFKHLAASGALLFLAEPMQRQQLIAQGL